MPKQNGDLTSPTARSYPGGFAYRQVRLVIALALMLCMGFAGTVTATSSTNYRATETQFGNGASIENCSDNYCAQASVGDSVVGDSSSDNYGALSGSNISAEPIFEVSTAAADEDLGTLGVDKTATLTMQVNVRTHLSNGYVIQIAGTPPANGRGHTLAAMDAENLECPCVSNPGTEQFGINLVANSSPNVGADPVQQDSGLANFGTVTADYIVPNLFKYEDGDIVAESNINNGQTNYTVSMILNISNTTPSGYYAGTFAAVVVPIY